MLNQRYHYEVKVTRSEDGNFIGYSYTQISAERISAPEIDLSSDLEVAIREIADRIIKRTRSDKRSDVIDINIRI